MPRRPIASRPDLVSCLPPFRPRRRGHRHERMLVRVRQYRSGRNPVNRAEARLMNARSYPGTRATEGGREMTFSIVAFDPATRAWGVAVASKCLAVGYA